MTTITPTTSERFADFDLEGPQETTHASKLDDQGDSVEQQPWCARPDGPLWWLMVDLGVLTIIVGVTLVSIFDLVSTSLREPFGYGGDGLGAAAAAQTMIQTGWVQETSRLGAPFGQVLYDFPLGGDNAHYLIMKVMTWATGDWVLVINGFFLLSFFTAAWSAYLCQRWLGVGRIAAIVTSSLFAFAPYHFARGIAHFLLGSYFVVPIGVLLAVKSGSVVDEPTPNLSRWARIRRVLPWLPLCALVGSCGAYYAIFSVIVIAIASILAALTHRRRAPLVRGALFAATVTVTFMVNVGRSVLYQRREGANPLVAERLPIELDLYGLRLIQMLAPVPGQWFRPLADISTDLSVGPASEGSQYLGLVGAAALVWMLGWFVAHSIRADRGSDAVRAVLAALTVLLILIGTTGGLSWLLSLVGFNQIRAWNRISILIAFTSLCWLGLTVGPLIRTWSRGRQRRRFAAFGLAGVVLVVGLTDQASIDSKPDPAPWAASVRSDRDFFTAVEAALPTDAMVYQLPYRRFPEEPPQFRSGDYDLLRPYLNTQDLRWSYGGMKGREAEWQQNLTELDTPTFLKAVTAVGFQGLVIDRYGYEDRAAELSTALQKELGAEPLDSPDRRWYFFDLSGRRAQYLGDELDLLKQRLLDYTFIDYQGCWPLEGQGAGRFRWCGPTVDAVIGPLESGVADAEFSFTAVAPAGVGNLLVDVGGNRTNHRIGPTATTITVSVPANIDVVVIRTDAAATTAPGETRDLRFQVFSPTFESTNP